MSHTFRSEFRWIETSTPASYHQSLLSLLDYARDHYFIQFPVPGTTYPLWVIRAVELQLQTIWVPPGTTAYTIDTRITKLGRTSLTFEQQVIGEEEVNEGERTKIPLAIATTIVVFIASVTDIRPIRIPESVRALPSFISRTDARPPMPAAIPETAFRYMIRVRHTDCDVFGHVTNSRYMSYWHDAIASGRHAGLFQHEDSDVACAEILYEREAKNQEEICVWVWHDVANAVYNLVLKRQDGSVGAIGRMWVHKIQAVPSKL